MAELDIVDQCLVALLQADGRLSHAELARRLGVPEATVRRRVQRLVHEGVIQIVAVPDPHKIGYSIHAIVGLRIQPGKVSQVLGVLKPLRQVRYVGVTAGTYDVVIEALFQNNDELREFLTETLGRVDGLQRTETSYVLDIAKRAYKVGLAADLHKSCASPEDLSVLARCRAALDDLEERQRAEEGGSTERRDGP
jgi:Lrp/AsnC family transcriptional regulator, regulator for asnA, asnC and gidA